MAIDKLKAGIKQTLAEHTPTSNQERAQFLLYRMRVGDIEACLEFGDLIPKDKITADDYGTLSIIELLYHTDLNEDDVGMIKHYCDSAFMDDGITDDAANIPLLGALGSLAGAAPSALYFKQQKGFDIKNLDAAFTEDVATKIAKTAYPTPEDAKVMYKAFRQGNTLENAIKLFQISIANEPEKEKLMAITDDIIELLNIDPNDTEQEAKILNLSQKVNNHLADLGIPKAKMAVKDWLMSLFTKVVSHITDNPKYQVNKYQKICERFSTALDEIRKDATTSPLLDTEPDKPDTPDPSDEAPAP